MLLELEFIDKNQSSGIIVARRDTSGRLRGQISKRVQVKNPVTGRWVKIDTTSGKIIDHKKTQGPYKNVRKKN